MFSALVIVPLWAMGLATANEVGNQTQAIRVQKLFNIFSVVRFKQDSCKTFDSLTGTCMTSEECSSQSGQATGSCAMGFGVCCLFMFSACGSSSSRNCTYITNPGSPSAFTAAGECSYTIGKADSDVCSIRLDFTSLSLASPNLASAAGDGAGVCATDVLTFVTTQPRTYPPICGENTGYHAYFDVSGPRDSLALSFSLGGSSSSRSWQIKATQVPCSQAPPSCCFQYFTSAVGRIDSFNFINGQAPVHLADQNYAICIRQGKGDCCISYSAVPNPDGWEVTSATCIADCNTAATCAADYLLIPNASADGDQPTFGRFCGNVLNVFATIVDHPIVSCSNPFEMFFHTMADGSTGNNRGFALNYRQIPCGANGSS